MKKVPSQTHPQKLSKASRSHEVNRRLGARWRVVQIPTCRDLYCEATRGDSQRSATKNHESHEQRMRYNPFGVPDLSGF